MSEPVNPYHKPAGFYKPIIGKPVSEMTIPERFALMFGDAARSQADRMSDEAEAKLEERRQRRRDHVPGWWRGEPNKHSVRPKSNPFPFVKLP